MNYQTNNKVITELITLDEIFTERMFVIPDYQRGYSWEEQQLTDLIKDIQKLCNKEHVHFTGTLVITKKELSTFEIVDGQQRLTSLLILLKAFYDKYPNELKYLYNKFFIQGDTGNESQVIYLGKENNDFYRDVVILNKDTSASIKSHSLILNAKTFFNDWILHQNINYKEYINIILNRLGFIVYQPESSNEIGIMFEVINNRGKSLSQLEKMKNYFIYFSTIHNKQTLREEINSRWSEILRNLNKAEIDSIIDENNFLRYCYLVYYEPNPRVFDIYDWLKNKYENKSFDGLDSSITEIRSFIEFLQQASLHYAYLQNSKGFFNISYNMPHKDKLNAILIKLRCHPVLASILPLYFSIMSQLSKQQNIMSVIELLEILEILNFRVYILPKIFGRADAKQSAMFKLANEFYRGKEWHSEIDPEEYTTPFTDQKIEGNINDWLMMVLKDYIKKICPEIKFIQSLTLDEDEYDNYYSWTGLSYFLASFEKFLQRDYHDWDIQNILKKREDVGKFTNDFLSKEHIWAKKNRPEQYPQDYIEKRRLGNFVLVGLSKNIQLSDNDIPLKIDELKLNNTGELRLYQIEKLSAFYDDSISFLQTDLKRVKKTSSYYEDLSRRLNDLRETDMIKFALENWKLPEETFNKFVRVDSFEARKINRREKYILNE